MTLTTKDARQQQITLSDDIAHMMVANVLSGELETYNKINQIKGTVLKGHNVTGRSFCGKY